MHNIAKGNQNKKLLQSNIDNTWLHRKLLYLTLTPKTSAFDFNIEHFCISFQRQQMATSKTFAFYFKDNIWLHRKLLHFILKLVKIHVQNHWIQIILKQQLVL